ncbi:hypothetical protein ACRAWD_12140 [Caulobacter segnis]
MMGTLSGVAGRVASRVGARAMLTVGPIMAGIGFGLLGGPWIASGFWTGVLPGLLILALGMTISVAPLTSTVMAAVPSSHSKVASGINNAVASDRGPVGRGGAGPGLFRARRRRLSVGDGDQRSGGDRGRPGRPRDDQNRCATDQQLQVRSPTVEADIGRGVQLDVLHGLGVQAAVRSKLASGDAAGGIVVDIDPQLRAQVHRPDHAADAAGGVAGHGGPRRRRQAERRARATG